MLDAVHVNSLHFGHLHLQVLSVFLAAGLVAALFVCQRVAPLAGVEREVIWNASLLAAFCGVVSFRLASLRSLAPSARLLESSSASLWAVVLSFAVTMGAVFVYLRGRSVQVLRFLDGSAPGLALLWAFVSVGSFIGGRSGAPTRLPWGVVDPALGRVHPVEMYAALAALCLSAGLWRALVFTAGQGLRPGATFFTGVFTAGALMFFLDFTARPDGGSSAFILDQLQWLGLGMVVVGFLMLRRPAPARSVSRRRVEGDSHAL